MSDEPTGVPVWHPEWGPGHLIYYNPDARNWFVFDDPWQPELVFVGRTSRLVPYDLPYRIDCPHSGGQWLILHDWETDRCEPILMCPPPARWHVIPEEVRRLCDA